jgi:hypothetical protein
MKKCKYYVGCYGFEGTTSGFKTMRTVTSVNQNGAPLFEMNVTPLEFTSEGADRYMRELLGRGWVAVTIRAPYDNKYICRN